MLCCKMTPCNMYRYQLYFQISIDLLMSLCLSEIPLFLTVQVYCKDSCPSDVFIAKFVYLPSFINCRDGRKGFNHSNATYKY